MLPEAAKSLSRVQHGYGTTTHRVRITVHQAKSHFNESRLTRKYPPGHSGENGQSMRQNCATKHRNGKPAGFREADLLESNKRD